VKQQVIQKDLSEYSKLSKDELLNEIAKLHAAAHGDGLSTNGHMSLERVLNSLDEVVYHIDLTKPESERIRFVGNNIEKVFGITRAEFTSGQNMFMNNCHPEDIVAVREKADALRKSRQPGTFLYRYYKKQTSAFIWIEERVIPAFDEAGNQTEVIGVARDITEQVNYRTQLLQSEERFRLLAQNANDIIYKLTFYPHARYEFISPSVEKVTGYAPEEYYADAALSYKICHPDDQEKMLAASELMKQNSPKIFAPEASPLVFRSYRKDGSEVWTETSNRPVFDSEGNVIGIEGISRDVTQRKLAENALIDSRESYRSLVEQHPEGIVIADSTGKIVFINPAVLRITRIDHESEIIGQNIMKFLTPEQQQRSALRVQQVKRGQYAPFEVIQLLNTKGEVIEMESRPAKYQYQGEESLLIFLRDITAERLLETEQLRFQLVEETNRKLQREIEERITMERELNAAQKNLRMLVDSSLDMICASDPNGLITEFNNAAQQTFGYSAEEVLGKHVTMLYQVPEERMKVMEMLMMQDGFFSGEVTNKRKNGTSFTAFLSASILKDTNGNVIGSMGVSRDISAIKNAETELRLSEEKYRAIYSQAYIGIALVDKDNGKFIEVNQRLCDILGYEMEDLQRMTVHELRLKGDLSHLPSGKEFIKRGFERVFDEQRYRDKAGREVILNITISLVKDPAGQPLHFVYVYEDITPKRRAEEQIRLQAAKLSAVFESSSHMIWTMDHNYQLVSFNNNQARWLRDNYDIKPYVGMPLLSGSMVSTEQYNTFWKDRIDQAFAGETIKFETEYVNKRGVHHWREVFLNPIKDERDTVIEVSCIAHDITDQKVAEENIRQSLKEKEVLLKEVHHRVKNNLQVISSILNLQSSYVKDKKSLDLLLESQNRIKSMAFVHESLYQTKDFSNINFSSYVENICSNLVHSYSNPDNPPQLNMDLESIQLNLDTAIPCGLIINELISNALKYAFKGKDKGRLDVLVKSSGDKLRIVIADNGKGLPENIDFRNTESLGLQLVVTLVEQINGKIALETKKGTKFTIEFVPPRTNQ
jgi:PAS domain S-box-containing protein